MASINFNSKNYPKPNISLAEFWDKFTDSEISLLDEAVNGKNSTDLHRLPFVALSLAMNRLSMFEISETYDKYFYPHYEYIPRKRDSTKYNDIYKLIIKLNDMIKEYDRRNGDGH